MILLLAFTYFLGEKAPAEKNTEKNEPYELVMNDDVEDNNLSWEEPVTTANEGKDETESSTIVTPPTEEQELIPVDDGIMYCTISIRCDTILENMNSLDEAKHSLIPPDGIILAKKEVTFNKGESVFDVLLRETRNNKIHMEYVKSPVYNSAYIEGIHNLYEFDCGDLSGWMYSVNGWFPNYGCSSYMLNDGDDIEWVYTCNLGKDVQ